MSQFDFGMQIAQDGHNSCAGGSPKMVRHPRHLWLRRITTKWKTSSEKWAVNLTKVSLEIPLEMWDHHNTVLHDAKHR